MKCPKCLTELLKNNKYGIEVDYCTACQGMWLDMEELDQLEDRSYKEDDLKGSLMLTSEQTQFKCPHCGDQLHQFEYRLNNLMIEYCKKGHGYWLDAKEEIRVTELMADRKAAMERKEKAEDQWYKIIRTIKNPSFFDKLKNLLKK
jgi:Zn-finger nucleic acid-binding protein